MTDGRTKIRQEKTMWFPFHIHNLYETKGEYSKEKILAECCLKFSCTRRCALEILNSLIATGKIIEKERSLYVFDDYENFLNSKFKNGLQPEPPVA
jgi:hypothetical protein